MASRMRATGSAEAEKPEAEKAEAEKAEEAKPEEASAPAPADAG